MRLDERFVHTTWFNQVELTIREALEYFASEPLRFFIQHRNGCEALYGKDDNNYYFLTKEEAEYFKERKEFWLKFRDNIYIQSINSNRTFLEVLEDEKYCVPQYVNYINSVKKKWYDINETKIKPYYFVLGEDLDIIGGCIPKGTKCGGYLIDANSGVPFIIKAINDMECVFYDTTFGFHAPHRRCSVSDYLKYSGLNNRLDEYMKRGEILEWRNMYWKEPEHINILIKCFTEGLDPVSAIKYAHLFDLMGCDVGIDYFRTIDEYVWNNDDDIRNAEIGNNTYELIDEALSLSPELQVFLSNHVGAR